MPPIQNISHISNLIYKGNTITVRYMHEGTVLGFESRISYFVTNPVKLIFIEYLEKIETHDLRVHKRLDCFLPASVSIADNSIEGTITNISKEGCHFVADKLKIESSSMLLGVDNEIDVNFQLPGVEKILAVKAKQKNIKKDNDNVSVGLNLNLAI